jgi:uncharacterized membrane protein SpoIIM required for sporulation
MRQQDFEHHASPRWSALAGVLDDLQRAPGRQQLRRGERAALPRLYRQVCNDYALARSRHYSPALGAELHELVLRGHRQIYRRNDAWGWRLLAFVLADFPRTLREQAGYFWLSCGLFLLPALLIGVGCYLDQDLVFALLDEAQVGDMEAMYDPAERLLGRNSGRAAETDFTMFGFYIANNIGVGFRTFAGGVFFGLGSLFFLVFNGLMIGAVAGHLSRLGFTDTFWPFVSGHGSFELTAIVICGAAGLMLGHALLAPGPFPRLQALRRRAVPALRLVMGAAAMLVVAAFIEAFWSAGGFPPAVKYTVAAGLWLLVVLYLLLAGRGSRGPH